MLLREIGDLRHLRLGDVPRINADDGVALVMDGEHQVRRLGLRLVEELGEHQDDELHGGVVVVVEDDLVLARLLDLGALDGLDVALALGVTALGFLAHGLQQRVAS